ncbi:MAG TPA: SAM-dependent chlorinase/fluorinase [Actinomycetota bacterium]|nr:SAM-dependent chlorinase/fluorinase [Actinomycetota bacterium]
MHEGFGCITFLSDFGLKDEYVAVCKGVILTIAPEAQILDITHQVSPQNVREAALLLERAVGFMPVAVHLAVVDPGVGTARRPVIAESADGSAFVGPDNGLLRPALARRGGVRRCRIIANSELMLPVPSRTFHGRDIFSPAAAYLFRGVPVEDFGPEILPESLVELPVSLARLEDDRFHAEVIYIDHFGNLELNLKASDLGRIGATVGSRIELQIGGMRLEVPFEATFDSVPEGGVVLTEDSAGSVSISVNRGSAAQVLLSGRRTGSKAVLRLAEGGSGVPAPHY